MIAYALAALTAVAGANTGPPQRTTMLTGKAAAEVMKQCSRSVPARGQGLFRPTAAQIAMLDHAAAARSGKADIGRTYAVEVVGTVRGGRRFVYGNYYPISLQDGVKFAPSTPTVVCDGGPQFFGIEVDAATGRLTHAAFNGPR